MKTINITLYKTQLLDDVTAKIHFNARSRATTAEQESLMQEASGDDNVDVILRAFNNGVGKILNIASQYSTEQSASATDIVMSVPDSDDEDTLYIIFTMSMPDNYNETMAYSMAQAMHNFLVNMALYTWFKVVSPTDAEGYKTAMDEDAEALQTAMTRRTRITRSDDDSTGQYIYEITYSEDE